MSLPDEHEGPWLVRLAEASIRDRLGAGDGPVPLPGVPPRQPSLLERRGVFVTLTRDDRLRGCVGRITSPDPLYRAVVATAASAATEDPRFAPLSASELAGLRIEVSVLDRPRPVDDTRSIVIGRDGVILDAPGTRSLFLPQVALRLGWDVERLLEELARKAGLSRDAWHTARLERFETVSWSAVVPGIVEKPRPE